MRTGITKLSRHSKRGTTLVELVVAMALMSIFAVVCVALINPIERIYTQTSKMASAQLLADTVIDAIRNECDDVDNNDINSVWIADVTVADENTDDSQLFNGPAGLKTTSGPVLVIKRNNGYCEAVYECLSISETNQNNVHSLASENGVDPDTTAFAVDKILEGAAEGAAQGIVHFGYYKATDNGTGVYPLKAYDYTNPMMASSYNGYYVKLRFKDLTTRTVNGEKIPSFVQCVVEVYEGEYSDDPDSSSMIYSRTAPISFSANGSAPGSGNSGGGSGSTNVKKDIEVRVLWEDEDNKDGLRPDAVTVHMTVNGSTSNSVIIRKDSSDKYTYTFANVEVDPSDANAIVITQDAVAGYRTLPTVVNGDVYIITNRRKEDTAKLVNGQTFNGLIGTDVDYVFFGSKDMITDEATKAIFEAATGPTNIAIPIDSNDSSAGKRIDDYVLYKYTNSSGEITAYVLSEDGYFVANEASDRMFSKCSKLKSITNITHINTEPAETMVRMFEECYSLKSLELPGFVTTNCTNLDRMFSGCFSLYYLDLSGWQTQNVQYMIKMFQGVNSTITSQEGYTFTPDQPMTVLDISMFDFSSCVDASYMFGYMKYTTNQGLVWPGSKFSLPDLPTDRGIQTIILPATPNFSSEVSIDMKYMFAENYGLQTIENIVSLGTARASSCQNMFKDCRSLTTVNIPFTSGTPSASAENMFDGCSSMTFVSLGNWTMSKNKSCKNMFRNCSSLGTVSIPIQAYIPCESAENMFDGCTSMTSVSLGEWKMSKNNSCKNMFRNCRSLGTVSIPIQMTIPCSTTESMFEGCTNISSISLGIWNMADNTTMLKMFKNCSSLTDIMNFDSKNLANVKNINELYYGCSSLGKNADSVSFNVNLPLCQYANSVFYGCTSLKEVNMNNAQFGVCTQANWIFYNCSSLKEVNMNDAKFESCTQAKQLFYGCTSLTKVHMEKVHFDVCTDLSNMFQKCSSLTHIYMSQIHLNNVTNLGFLKVNSLTYLDLSQAQLNKVTSLKELFKSKTALVEVDFEGIELPNCTTCESLFNGCKNLTMVNMKSVHLEDCTTFSSIFKDCTKLTSIYMSGAYLNKLESISNVIPDNATYLDFSSAKLHSISSLDKAFESRAFTYVDFTDTELNICTSYKYMFLNCANLVTVKWSPVTTITEPSISCEGMFENCSAVTSFDLGSWDSSNVNNMSYMFSGCTGVLEFNFSNSLNSSNVTDMSYMFYNCQNATSFNLTGLITSNVTTMKSMFYGCHSATSFNLSTWDTSKVTDMSEMFRDCYCLTQFNTSTWTGWDTSEVTTMSYMFYNCSYKGNADQEIGTENKYINISNFSFAKVTDTSFMFACERKNKLQPKEDTKDIIDTIYLPSVAKGGNPLANELINSTKMFDSRECLSAIENLYEFTNDDSLIYARAMFARVNCTELNIYNLDFSYLNNSENSSAYMFDNCTVLVTIYVKPGTDYTNNIHKYQFNNDNNIVGGSGYTYNGQDKTYARVDGLDGKSGYFTEWTGA